MKTMIKILSISIVCYTHCALSVGQGITSTVSKSLFPKISNAVIKKLNEETKGKAIFGFAGKKATEKLLEKIVTRVKKGLDPSREDLSILDDYSFLNNHGVLNFADEKGHTLLYYVLKNNPSLSGYKGILRNLYRRGAQLNIHDKYVMGPESVLKTSLNMSIDASAANTIKVMRTFLTKNTSEKIKQRFSSFGVLTLKGEKRLAKVADTQELYQRVESDLLTQKQKEVVQKKKDKYFKFDEL